MITQFRLGSSLVLALLGSSACAEATRPAPQTVILPAVSPEPSPATAAPGESPRRRAEPAPAAPEDAARAEALFREGRQLTEQGKFPEACEAFAESMRLDAAVGTLLNWAQCAERSGDTKRACVLLGEARVLARDKGSSEREKFAAQRLTQLGCP